MLVAITLLAMWAVILACLVMMGNAEKKIEAGGLPHEDTALLTYASHKKWGACMGLTVIVASGVIFFLSAPLAYAAGATFLFLLMLFVASAATETSF